MLLRVFLAFTKIGAFSFGGGYAMIPLIQREIVTANSWLSATDFIDIIAIAEMTPGPIAVNSSTFVGYKIAGIPGAIVSTLGVILPSFIIITVIAALFGRIRSAKVVKNIFRGIRPVVIALILLAGVFVGKTALIDLKSAVLFLLSLVIILKTNIHPIAVIGAGAALGILFF